LSELPVALAGRAAEEIVFGDITTGAQNDLQQVTKTARSMVCQYGMSDKLGHMTLGQDQSMVFLGRDLGHERDYSEQTAQLIDAEVKQIIDVAYDKAKEILIRERDRLDLLAMTLIEKETLEAKAVRELLKLPKDGPAPPDKKSPPKT